MTKHVKMRPEEHGKGISVNAVCEKYPGTEWLLNSDKDTKKSKQLNAWREAIMVADVDAEIKSQTPARALTFKQIKAMLIMVNATEDPSHFRFLLACPNAECRIGNLKPASMKKHTCKAPKPVFTMADFCKIPLEIPREIESESESVPGPSPPIEQPVRRTAQRRQKLPRDSTKAPRFDPEYALPISASMPPRLFSR